MLKAVIHINFADAKRQAHGLGNIRNIRSEAAAAELEVICHGAGISLLIASENENAEAVSELLREGDRFAACQQTLKSQEISPEELISGVELVSSGAVEVISKQQQGYAYFRP